MTGIFILGMHRSGTSATTRALGLLGASLGPDRNLGQFWENQVMRRPNEKLLEAFGGGWDAPPLMPDGWKDSPEARALVPEAKAALAEYGDAPVWVFKDPRTCMTLPFWLDQLGEPPVVVSISRHPVEVAGSLQIRNQLRPAHGYALWERFNADALQSSVGLRTVVLRYRDLVDDPKGTMRRVVDALARWGVQLPNDPETTDMELTASRRHHHTDAEERFDDPVATPSQRELFRLLDRLSGAWDSFALPEPLPRPSPLSVEILQISAQFRASRLETRRVKNELAATTGSRRRLLRTLVQGRPELSTPRSAPPVKSP